MRFSQIILLLVVVHCSWAIKYDDSPKIASVGDRVLKVLSNDAIYKLMMDDLTSYVLDEKVHAPKSAWITNTRLSSFIHGYCEDRAKDMTHFMNAEQKSSYVVLENGKALKKAFSESTWLADCVAEQNATENLFELTMNMLSAIAKHMPMRDALDLLKKHQPAEFKTSRFYLKLNMLNSKYHSNYEDYIQSLLDFAYPSNTDFRYDGIGFGEPPIAIQYMETGDPRCLKVLTNINKHSRNRYNYQVEVLNFIVANGGNITDEVLSKALDYPSDVLRMWALRKVCKLKIRALYPKLKDIFNSAVDAGINKNGITLAIWGMQNDFPYKVPTGDSEDTYIPDDAQVRNGF